MSQYELIIHNGTVVDGTGNPPASGDIAIANGRIAAIGTLPAATGVPVLDASGLVVAPGFIDIHSHSDFTLLVDPRAVSSIAQGVTLEVVGNCGHGCAPIRDPALARMNIYGAQLDFPIDWSSVSEYLERLEQARPAVNVIKLVPNGNLRLAVAGLVDRPSSPDELRQMQSLLAEGLEAGAFGYSTGLEYGPERACSEHEITELCKTCAHYGGLYATHTRNRNNEAAETIAEAIRTATVAGVPLQISHISSVSRLAGDSRWAMEQALAQVDQARRQGIDVTFDMHTRLFGTTNLSAALPASLLSGRIADVARRLRDPAIRRQIRQSESIVTALARHDWRRIVLFRSSAQPELIGRNIAELSAERNLHPLDLICDLLIAENEEMHSLMILAYAYQADDAALAFERSDCMIGSDATALAPDGPLGNSAFHGAYTWAAWFFRHFVRETRALTAQEAVRRLTSLPAARMGLSDRGIIKEGMQADIAIFDPATFGEKGDTYHPNQVATGMQHVLVNGVTTLSNGVITGARAGMVLRRAA
jgi:N-acyl-D-amino-acid deacylase